MQWSLHVGSNGENFPEKNPKGSGGSRMGQREKLSCESSATEASVLEEALELE